MLLQNIHIKKCKGPGVEEQSWNFHALVGLATLKELPCVHKLYDPCPFGLLWRLHCIDSMTEAWTTMLKCD
jgi:hypothetical protein